jgi:hypothetical protein
VSLFEEIFMDYRITDSMGRVRRFAAPFWRLWWRSDRTAGLDGCWPFQGALSSHGYGQLSLGRRKGLILAHRLAHMASTLEEIPAGLGVLHACDNPPCCNPRHLRAGTQADNAADMVARGRVSRLANEQSAQAKLSNADVAEIRLRCAGGETQTTVARDFGVHPAHVSRIVNVRRRPIRYSDSPPEA